MKNLFRLLHFFFTFLDSWHFALLNISNVGLSGCRKEEESQVNDPNYNMEKNIVETLRFFRLVKLLIRKFGNKICTIIIKCRVNHLASYWSVF